MKRVILLLFIGVFISETANAQYPQYYGQPQVMPYNSMYGNAYAIPQQQIQYQYLYQQQNFIQPQFCGGCRFQLVSCRCRRGLGGLLQQLFPPRYQQWVNFQPQQFQMPMFQQQWQQPIPMPIYNNNWQWNNNGWYGQQQFQGNSFGYEMPYWRTY